MCVISRTARHNLQVLAAYHELHKRKNVPSFNDNSPVSVAETMGHLITDIFSTRPDDLLKLGSWPGSDELPELMSMKPSDFVGVISIAGKFNARAVNRLSPSYLIAIPRQANLDLKSLVSKSHKERPYPESFRARLPQDSVSDLPETRLALPPAFPFDRNAKFLGKLGVMLSSPFSKKLTKSHILTMLERASSPTTNGYETHGELLGYEKSPLISVMENFKHKDTITGAMIQVFGNSYQFINETKFLTSTCITENPYKI